jgi:hypothetical protein
MERHDGFGTRWLVGDDRVGAVETLQLTVALASPEAERAMRERAARAVVAGVPTMVPVDRIERTGDELRLVSQLPAGVRLTRVLSALERGDLRLPATARLELIAALVHAVAQLHARPGAGAHGAITPQHIVVTADGTVRLTHGVLGSALEALQLNREQLWRDFMLAMPASASLPRFDPRADVPQLAGVALAVLLARRLREDEYPRGIAAVVAAATADLSATARCRTGLRLWLEQAMQLHPHVIFSSAVDADAALGQLLVLSASRRAAQFTLQAAIRQLLGEQTPPCALALGPTSPPTTPGGPTRLFVPSAPESVVLLSDAAVV